MIKNKKGIYSIVMLLGTLTTCYASGDEPRLFWEQPKTKKGSIQSYHPTPADSDEELKRMVDYQRKSREGFEKIFPNVRRELNYFQTIDPYSDVSMAPVRTTIETGIIRTPVPLIPQGNSNTPIPVNPRGNDIFMHQCGWAYEMDAYRKVQ